METSYKTTLKCGACLSKVTPGLNQVQGLLHWSVDLSHPDRRLRVRVDNPAVLDDVVAAVRQAGFDAVPAMTAERSTTDWPAVTAERSTTLSLRTYWPLILVLIYLVGGVFYVEWIAAGGGHSGAGQGNGVGQGWSWHRAMSSFMGFFFVAFAFFKLLDVASFADAFAYSPACGRVPRGSGRGGPVPDPLLASGSTLPGGE
jgi:cation transport ATPase